MKRLCRGRFGERRRLGDEICKNTSELALCLEGPDSSEAACSACRFRVADITDLALAKQVATLALAENERLYARLSRFRSIQTFRRDARLIIPSRCSPSSPRFCRSSVHVSAPMRVAERAAPR